MITNTLEKKKRENYLENQIKYKDSRQQLYVDIIPSEEMHWAWKQIISCVIKLSLSRLSVPTELSMVVHSLNDMTKLTVMNTELQDQYNFVLIQLSINSG